ncbi:uncharacterized protein CTHT_0021830 [Thermochaetoides thermophila DSM 1495]|uniref:Uncharacterized protein n=1 Tax=Chaetomium thermophilum (strain DSM 1495 / CBS 144.50 / IMI 039719) TaxID=759272 RepID=G0S3M9_CHATD|nr:hypothetical protein CTHT_0021830 [Thermochaetoides thermophila DSM 1495]EGS20356.1 hypothetical protein CTHT_0021830 [Thermochaetoides thermophila DSM 1495]
MRPIATGGPTKRSSRTGSEDITRFRARPSGILSPNTISTLALGSMLAGSWYIWHEGRNYKVNKKVQKYEEKPLGKHRGNVNADYMKYDNWVDSRRASKGK